MTIICKQCETINQADPLHCKSCGAQIRRTKLSGAGRLILLLLMAGWVITPIACIRLIYLVLTDESFALITFVWQFAAWVIGFRVFLWFMEMFEGVARPR